MSVPCFWNAFRESCIGRAPLQALRVVEHHLVTKPSVPGKDEIMAIRQTALITRPLRTLWSSGVFGALPDTQLVDRFVASHSEEAEAAFDALVHRHGPMVLRVCREILCDSHDADDAFQATFLVLVLRVSSIRDQGSLASWLYGVATRVALRARADAARRREVERQGACSGDGPSPRCRTIVRRSGRP